MDDLVDEREGGTGVGGFPEVPWQVIIFVDNSGADVILGILPFARELLRRGSQVC